MAASFKRSVGMLLAGTVLALMPHADPARARSVRPAPAMPAVRPDLVIFVADDLRRDDLRAYGGMDARTPNIDRFAEEGVRFANAFAASPSCSPSRSSLYTGNFPMRHGGHANHSPIHGGMPTMPTYLQKLGYRVVIAGKTHVGERPNFPFEYMPSSVVKPAGGGPLTANLDMAAIDRLIASRDPAKPLALIVNSFAPHVPWATNDGYDPQSLHVPPYLVDTPETRAAMARYFTRVSQADREFGELRASLARHGSTNTLLMFTADQGSQFPFGKWNLYDAGIAVPLIASWSGKIAPGTTAEPMVSLVDVLPTFQEAAHGKATRTIDGCSFLPVLRGAKQGCRQEIYAAHSGVPDNSPEANVAPMRTIRTPRYKLIVNFRPDIRYVNAVSNGEGRDRAYWDSWVKRAETDPKAAAVIKRFHDRVPVEFYDLKADPYELNNLAGAKEHAADIATLRGKLTAWMVQQGENPAKVALPSEAPRGKFPYGQ